MRPGLLATGSRLWTPRSQIKPLGVPRIDWTHPLARGLVFYGFDLGNGMIVDLAGGRQMNQVPGTSLAPIGATQWGTGIAWNNSDARYFNSDALIRISAPFTCACAIVKTGTVVQYTSPFNRTCLNNASQPFVNWSFELNPGNAGQNTAAFGVNNNGTFAGSSNWTGLANSTFTSLAGVVSNGSAAVFYAQGTAQATMTGLNVTNNNTQDGIIYSGTSQAASNVPMIGFIFYGAFWNRALSADEVAWLHFEPYCFLLPQEASALCMKGPLLAGLSARGFAMARSMAAPSGRAGLATIGSTSSFGRGLVRGAVNLGARTTTNTWGRTKPVPTAGLSARGQGIAVAPAAAKGFVNLSAWGMAVAYAAAAMPLSVIWRRMSLFFRGSRRT